MGDRYTPADFPESFFISDEIFAAAYEGLSDEHRAHIKRQIAFLYKIYGSPADRPSTTQKTWDNGFSLTRKRTPVDTVFVVCGDRFASAPQAVAAVLPPLLLGVRNVFFVRLDDAEPDDILAAMELCGVEQVMHLPKRDVQELTVALEDCGTGVLILLDDDTPDSLSAEAVSLGWRVLRPRLFLHQREIGVYAGPVSSPDWEALRWAYPEARFVVRGGADNLPAGVEARDGGLQEFHSEGLDVLIVPPEEGAAAMHDAALVLEHGMETCWMWPVLDEAVFMRNRLRVGRSEYDPTGDDQP